MKRIMWAVLLSCVVAGCEEFPLEEGGDDLAGAAHHQAHPRHAHGGLDDRLLNMDSER
jgi:hypothetical protein